MQIKKKSNVESLPLNEEIIDVLYPVLDGKEPRQERDVLLNIINFFRDEIQSNTDKFRCYIEQQAFDAFVAFANDAYLRSHNEATGIIMGYYLHDEKDPERKIIVATNFIQANGPATSVTCTISYDDNIRYDNFCTAHQMNQLVWIHSHPGYGCFYSGTDSSMLASCFYAKHQIGVVVDNLRNEVMGFKIVDGEEKNENVYCYDIVKSVKQNRLQVTPMYLKPDSIPIKREQNQLPNTENEIKKKRRIEITKKGTNENVDNSNIADITYKELNSTLVKCKSLLDGMIKLEHLNIYSNDLLKSKKYYFWSFKNPLHIREILFAVIALVGIIFMGLYLRSCSTTKEVEKKWQQQEQVQHDAQHAHAQKAKQ